MPEFQQYKELILQEIRDLKGDQKELFAFLREHMEKEEVQNQEIRERLIKLEQDRLWSAKLTSVVISALISGATLLLGCL